MAFLEKPSPAIAVVVLVLLATQPAYSERNPMLSPICKAKCHLHCLRRSVKHAHYRACVMTCYIIECGNRAQTLSHPSFECGVGCVMSKCSNHGDGNGKASKECLTSCVNNCDGRSICDRY